MNKRLPSHLKNISIKRALPSVLLLVCGIGLGMRWNEVVSQTQQTVLPESRYTLEQIPDIQDIFSSVGNAQSTDEGSRSTVEAAILPHHTAVGATMDRFWFELSRSSTPDVIVLISPAHEEQGQSPIQTTQTSWETPFGIVQTDTDLIKRLQQDAQILIEPTSFEYEHGIGVHMPFIAEYFSDVSVVPIIAKSQAGQSAAGKLVATLRQSNKNMLLVSSIDFAHYQSAVQSSINDEETWHAMEDQQLDVIDRFGPEHVDSSFALDAYLLWQQQQGCLSSERWHEYNPAGTSYGVFFCTEQPLFRVSAVGDVMLARGVAQSMYRSTIPASVSLLRHVSSGSDVVFGNLESVISDQGVAMDKAYTFEAPLSSVGLLEKMGFTHMSVANNHNADFGEAAFVQSADILTDHQIQPVGGYQNEPVVTVVQQQDKTMALLAFQDLTYPLDKTRVLQAIADASQENEFVVVSMHWGTEYQPQPDEEIVALAHAMIDAGADVILGHHPHVLQPVETYKNKLIFYSLGNFIFDQVGVDQNTSEVATIDFYPNEITYQLTPVQIDHFFPRHVRNNE